MITCGDYESDSEEVEKTFQKITRDCKKQGFRDGVIDGRESKFQSSFDEGYKDGFTNAFKLGLIKGQLIAEGKPINDSLKSTRKGACLLCQDKTLLEKPIKEIQTMQSVVLNKLHN